MSTAGLSGEGRRRVRHKGLRGHGQSSRGRSLADGGGRRLLTHLGSCQSAGGLGPCPGRECRLRVGTAKHVFCILVAPDHLHLLQLIPTPAPTPAHKPPLPPHADAPSALGLGWRLARQVGAEGVVPSRPGDVMPLQSEDHLSAWGWAPSCPQPGPWRP